MRQQPASGEVRAGDHSTIVGGKVTTPCAWCWQPVTLYRSKIKGRVVCDRVCDGAWRSVNMTGTRAAHWKGGTTNDGGYILVHAPWSDMADDQGYVPLHLLVFRLTRGRKPLQGCIVHHRDLNKQNNSPENLQELTRPEHIAIHREDLLRGRSGSV